VYFCNRSNLLPRHLLVLLLRWSWHCVDVLVVLVCDVDAILLLLCEVWQCCDGCGGGNGMLVMYWWWCCDEVLQWCYRVTYLDLDAVGIVLPWHRLGWPLSSTMS
jgi:hypothetical protein